MVFRGGKTMNMRTNPALAGAEDLDQEFLATPFLVQIGIGVIVVALAFGAWLSARPSQVHDLCSLSPKKVVSAHRPAPAGESRLRYYCS
jgi:hypothetical protein